MAADRGDKGDAAGNAGTEGADPYQAQYMGGDALYHDKIRAPLGFHLLLLFPLLVSFGSVIAAHGPIIVPCLTSLVLLAAWALFSVLRISVSRDVVYVQYGLFGPKIAVRDIERCEAVAYDWKKYGGWGIRYGRDGSVAYNMLGDGGRAVQIVYRDGSKTKTVLVASRDPERLAAAIQRARAEAAGGATKRMRVETAVDTEDAGAVDDEAAAEAEAAAAVEDAGGEKRRA